MRLARIVEAASRAAIDLKAEAELIEAVEIRGNEAVSIENARKGFQTVLTMTVGLLGDLPKTREAMQTRDCQDKVVVIFMESFHQAVMDELGRCEFLAEGSNKFVYGRFISKASNNFLRVLRDEIKEGKKRAPRMANTEIDFDETLMTKLAEQNAQAAWDEKERERAATMLPPLPKNLASSAFQRKAMPPADIRSTDEYAEVMARLKAEGKIL